MPVTIRGKTMPVPHSNKTEIEVKEEKIDYSYSYKMGNGHIAYVSPPMIDHITITLEIDDEEQRGSILDELMKVSTHGEGGFKDASAKTGYKFEINFTAPLGTHSIAVKAQPTNPKLKHFVKLEFNPHRIGRAGLELFKERIAVETIGALEWHMFLAEGKANRIDVAVDIRNSEAGQFISRSHKPGKSHIYVSAKGELETAYLGMKGGPTDSKKNSDQYYYDKAVQDAEAKKGPVYPGAVTRVELRKIGAQQKLSGIKKLGEAVLERFDLIHPGSAPVGTDELTWSLFLDSCRLRGTESALARLPDSMQMVFRDTLKARAELTWRPQKLWLHWSNIVDKSGLLDPGPPPLHA